MRQLVIVFLAAFSAAAFAVGPVGRVAETAGAVTAGPDTVRSGYPLQEGSRIVSEKDAEATLRMVDDSLITLSEASDLLIEKFVFNPGAVASQASYVLHQGIMTLTPGALAKRNQNAETVNTSYADLATSGANYAAGLCDLGCPDPAGLYIYLRHGQLRIATANSVTAMGAGQWAYVARQTGPVRFLSKPPQFMAVITANPLTASFELSEPATLRLRLRANEDILDPVIDPPASPSQPAGSLSR